jgi:hypothetical protein
LKYSGIVILLRPVKIKNLQKQMKKVLSILAVAAMFTFVACGPSAEEAAKKAAEDSTRIADSTAKAMEEQAAAAAAAADSMAKATMDTAAAKVEEAAATK